MDSCSSTDDPPLIAESFSFDETTFSVLPVISVGLSELERDPLEAEGLLSVPFCPTITYTTSSTPVDILADTTDDDLIPVDSCKSSILDEDVDLEQEVEIKPDVVEGEEEEGEETKVPLVVMEGGHVLQLDGGTLAYIYSHPQDGCQAVELEDGTVAYITLTQPLVLDPDPDPEPDPEPEPPPQRLKVADPPKKQKNYMCEHDGCGRLYTSSHHLKVHERTHTGVRPFGCTVEGCPKAFSTDYSRKAHVRTHTGEKPYKCMEHFCTKSFKTSGDLQKHVRTHTGERPFVCPVEGCSRSFTTSNIRKVHIRTHTGERPYVCPEPYCDKAFASATNFKNHIRIHSGEKPYCCNVVGCNKRFTEYSSLYKHHMVHTQEKPYQCGVCGRSYRQVSTLTVHKRTAHGVIEADDGTEIMLGNVFTQRVLKGSNTSTNTKKLKNFKAVPSNLLGDTEYILDSSGSIQRISSEQIFIIEDIPEHLRALQHIQDPEDELQAALDPLQEQ